MSDRRLIVGEFDPLDANNGKLFALAPNTATGVALPSFQVGTSRPRIGTTQGEGYFDTNQRTGFVWTGSQWEGIAASPVLSYDTEADLTADSAPRPGTYATAGDSGSLFIKSQTGWRQVGIKKYATSIDLFADTAAGVGTIAEVDDEDSLWEMTNSGWRLLVIREMPDTPDILAWDENAVGANIGDRVVDLAHDVAYIRTTNGWRPTTLWEDTEVAIRAATWVINGQEAIANDTGRTFVRVNDAWVEEPIQHYDTEGELLATDAADGTLAWADDSANVFARSGGAWVGTNTGFYDPTPIGTIAAYATATVPAGWLLCDGSNIPTTPDYNTLRTILGTTTVPDLRGQFLRGAASAADVLLTKHQWTTGMPRIPFATATAGSHTHTGDYTAPRYGANSGGDVNPANPGGHGNDSLNGHLRIDAAGDHTHTITGGDTETAPDHVKIHWCIKAKFATLVPANSLTVNTNSAVNNDVLTYDQATGSWRNKQWTHVGTAAPVNPAAGFTWFDTTPATRGAQVFDGTKWWPIAKEDKHFFEAEITLGANAATQNEIILCTGIPVNNGSIYISIGDMFVGGARSEYALHAFTNDSVNPSLIPIHINSTNTRFYNLRMVWGNVADGYLLIAKVVAGNVGVKYRVGMVSTNSDLSGVKADGNTIATQVGGPIVDCENPFPVIVQRKWSESTSETGPLHKVLLTPVTRYVKMDGSLQVSENYTVRPYYEFGGTEFDLFNKTPISHVFAMADYKNDGVSDTGNGFIDNHGCGLTFRNIAGYSVKSSTTFHFRVTIQKRGGGYWDIWQEAFYGSDNGTPMRMESKFQILATGDMTAIGVRGFDWTGATQKTSQHSLNVEAL